MTVNCAWCQKIEREVCPHCGHDAAPFLFRWKFFLRNFPAAVAIFGTWLAYGRLEKDLFYCGGLCKQILFLRGLGGITWGICKECSKQMRFLQVCRERQVV